MNKRGNMFFGIAVGFLIFVFGVLFVPFITDDVTTTRTDLDCTNSAITDGAKLNCLLTDVLTPYVILFILSAAGAFIIGRST